MSYIVIILAVVLLGAAALYAAWPDILDEFTPDYPKDATARFVVGKHGVHYGPRRRGVIDPDFVYRAPAACAAVHRYPRDRYTRLYVPPFLRPEHCELCAQTARNSARGVTVYSEKSWPFDDKKGMDLMITWRSKNGREFQAYHKVHEPEGTKDKHILLYTWDYRNAVTLADEYG